MRSPRSNCRSATDNSCAFPSNKAKYWTKKTDWQQQSSIHYMQESSLQMWNRGYIYKQKKECYLLRLHSVLLHPLYSHACTPQSQQIIHPTTILQMNYLSWFDHNCFQALRKSLRNVSVWNVPFTCDFGKYFFASEPLKLDSHGQKHQRVKVNLNYSFQALRTKAKHWHTWRSMSCSLKTEIRPQSSY